MGTTVNVPLPAGSGDGDYALAFESLIGPVVEQFDPDAVLVSAGQDIHVGDPLGQMEVTETGFGQMGLRVAASGAVLRRRDVSGLCLEGGYDRQATAHAIGAVLEALLDESASPAAAPTSQRPHRRGQGGRGTGRVLGVVAARRIETTKGGAGPCGVRAALRHR